MQHLLSKTVVDARSVTCYCHHQAIMSDLHLPSCHAGSATQMQHVSTAVLSQVDIPD